MRIQTNISAMNALRNLSATEGQQTSAIEKLSSGFRLNHAGDDAAGMSIANSLRSNAGALSQAQKNASQAGSFLQIADGGVRVVTAGEVEEMVRLLMEADGPTVWALLTAHLKAGRSIRSLGDAIQIGAAELILRTTVPRQFTDGQHPFDYCSTANYWMRTSENPYQPRKTFDDDDLSSLLHDGAQ